MRYKQAPSKSVLQWEVRPQDIERFESKIFPLENGCWYWTGTKNKIGYGWLKFSKPVRIALLAHRIAYELSVGPIPDKLVIDHLCRNPSCVNPRHLEVVTRTENVLRGTNTTVRKLLAGVNKTHCPQGHPYSPENTYVYRGCRACRICGSARTYQYFLRKRAKHRNERQ